MRNKRRLFYSLSGAALLMLISTSPAMASATAAILCNVVFLLQGKIGSGAATLAIISVGVAAVMGRASWGMAITVAIGIAVMFGAAHITFMLVEVPTCGYVPPEA